MPDDIENNGLPPGTPNETEEAAKKTTSEIGPQSPKEKLKEITDGIEKGIRELFASDQYADYLKTMSRFHNYSLNNIMLIYMQKPNATMVALGFDKWKNQFGRHVNKGEKAIKIIAPVLYNKKVEREKRDPQTQMLVVDEQGNPVMEEITVRVPKFKVTSVFDVAQTEGKPLPTLVHDLYGKVENYDVFMEAIRRSSPAPMEIVPLSQEEHGDGYYSVSEKHIYLRDGMSQAQTVSAAIHEMAHAILHSKEMLEAEKLANPEAKPKSKAQKEIEAESVSYACCQFFSIETKENSFGYIVNWSKDQGLPELKASLETINKTASAIITSIDRNLKEIVHEREEQPEKSQVQEAPAAGKEQMDTLWLSTSTFITPAGLLTPDCDVIITKDDLKAAGCDGLGLLPLTKDKAFELFDQDASIFALYRYVTEQSFHSYLWQTLENKQKFISQIMTSKSPVRSCEDVDETALSYAEIKALCAGDPRIKQKMDLDIEVARLRLMKADHDSKRYSLEDQIRKDFPKRISECQHSIEGLQHDLEQLAAHPLPAKDFVGMTVGGKHYSEKKDAGTAIIEFCKKHYFPMLAAFPFGSGEAADRASRRSPHLTTMDRVEMGEYRGFSMFLQYDAFKKEFEVTLQGEMSHYAALGSDVFGNIQRIDHALEGITERMNGVKTNLENYRSQLKAAQEEVQRPFPQEAELKEKSERLAELNADLNMDGRQPAAQEHEEPDESERGTNHERPSILQRLNVPCPMRSASSQRKQSNLEEAI